MVVGVQKACLSREGAKTMIVDDDSRMIVRMIVTMVTMVTIVTMKVDES